MRYELTRDSVLRLDELEQELARLHRELNMHVQGLRKGKRVSVLRSRKAAMELAKFLKEFRKAVKELEFTTPEAQ